MKKQHKSGYIYTIKKHTEKGIFSTILGVLVLVSLAVAIILTYTKRGNAPMSYGALGLLCTIFAGAGVVLGLISRKEPDKYYLFSNIGIGLNILDLLFISAILYAGI